MHRKAGCLPQDWLMVALITFELEGIGAPQVAQARHWHEEALRRHEVMGIHEGQGIVAG
jgi:hypothetical protein